MRLSGRNARPTGASWRAPPPWKPPMTRVSGYVLLGHPPMRIMGRFFIWEILNMPGVRDRERRAENGRERVGKGEFSGTNMDIAFMTTPCICTHLCVSDKAPTVYSKVTHDQAQNSLWTPKSHPPDRRQCVG